ncbi:MAG: hypothetical protein V4543_08465 [Bacteroidota bacterium]
MKIILALLAAAGIYVATKASSTAAAIKNLGTEIAGFTPEWTKIDIVRFLLPATLRVRFSNATTGQLSFSDLFVKVLYKGVELGTVSRADMVNVLPNSVQVTALTVNIRLDKLLPLIGMNIMGIIAWAENRQMPKLDLQGNFKSLGVTVDFVKTT